MTMTRTTPNSERIAASHTHIPTNQPTNQRMLALAHTYTLADIRDLFPLSVCIGRCIHDWVLLAEYIYIYIYVCVCVCISDSFHTNHTRYSCLMIKQYMVGALRSFILLLIRFKWMQTLHGANNIKIFNRQSNMHGLCVSVSFSS